MKPKFILLTLLSLFFCSAQEKPKDSDLMEYVDKEVKYCNKVYGSYKSEKVILLNLGADYPNQEMTIAFFKSDWKKFKYDPHKFLTDKEICVSGKLVLYKDRPEIIVKNPSQIEISE